MEEGRGGKEMGEWEKRGKGGKKEGMRKGGERRGDERGREERK